MSSAERTIILDATDRPLGRFASIVATHLRGKNLVSFTPNILPKVTVRIIHLRKVHVSAQRAKQPIYHFSGYPGGLKKEVFAKAFQKNPAAVFRNAVRRMLPDNRSRKRLLRFLILEE